MSGSIARGVLRGNERRFGVAKCCIPFAHGHARPVATLGRFASGVSQLSEVELAFFDGHLDLMHLISRLGQSGDRPHQRLARIGQRFLVTADLVRFLRTFAFELIRDFAQPIALCSRALERRCFLIELELLIPRFDFDLRKLCARDVDASAQIAQSRFRLPQE